MSAIMLCTCSGDQSKFEDLPRSPESLATRDFSANGSSSKMASRETTPDDSQVNEVESDLRETLSLNYEEARALLGRLEHQRGNFDAALQVLQGIDIRSLRPRMTTAIAESVKPRAPPRSSRRKSSQVNGMLMHMSMHSVSLLLEAILLKAKSLDALGKVTDAAEECRTIIDIIESAWPCGVPDGTAEECKLIDIFHSALEYLPKLWMRCGCFDEAIIAYRRALAKPWNLDSQRFANLQKDLAVTLLYCGVDVKFPQEFVQERNLVSPGNNIEEAILLLLILTRKLSLQEIKWDPDLVNHLMYALSLSGHTEVLASHLEMLLPGTYTRSDRWYILALCYSAAGMDDSALNIIRNGYCVLERKGKPHVPSLLLGAKLCCKNPKHASEGIKFANKAMKSFRSCDMHFISIVNHFLGVCYGPFSRSSTSQLDKSRLQDDALRLLQDAAAMAKYNPEILYSLAWENAMQRKLNAAVESATECLEMVMGGSVSAWKLLILVLSAQQNLQEAEAVADFAMDEAEKDDQLDILRLKAQVQASRGQFKSAVESFRLSETGAQSELSSEGKSDTEAQGFDLLKEENMLLKDDITFLKSKLIEINETEESLFELEKERATLDASLRELECAFIAAQSDMLKLSHMQHDAWWEKVENLEELLESTANQVEHAALVLDGYHDFQDKIDKLEASLGATKISEFCLYFVDHLKKRVKSVEERFQACSREMHSQIELYEHSIVEFNDTLSKLIKESEKKSMEHYAEGMPSEFWSRISLLIDGWSLEKKISSNDAKILREMAWKRDNRLREAYLSSRGMAERELIDSFLKMALPGTSSGLHIVHIAAEMAPVAKVGGLADVISGLGKALQKKGHLVEIILPKYDCMQHNQINNLKVLDVVVQSYFEGNTFANKIWTGTVEGLPVYFIEPQHPGKFFWRAQYYGEHDDFKRFSYFSRVALELLYQSGKKVDIIHCHDWQTAFVAPLYWDVYANLGFNSARICFTCHNFEYQGTAPAQDLAYCGLDVEHLDRPDRMRDNSHGRINVVKGAIVYSNVVTTVSPTYAQEVRSEGGRGLQDTLKIHSKKFVGILNGIDTDTWNPSTDKFLKVQYSANDLYGKSANKESLRKQLKMSSANASQPLVGCITRLVPQKGVHLIRHAIYKTAELGGQFVLLGSSPVPNIQREFEGIADQFQNNNNIRLLLKYDDALSHIIFAASDMFIVPSMFEPCGLTQMIAMRYGSVPVVRKTGGLNDSVFDYDDETIPMELRNGFTFLKADEQGFDSALERAFNYYHRKPEVWKQLVQKDMKIDFSWDTSASQYEDIYQRAAARARAAA